MYITHDMKVQNIILPAIDGTTFDLQSIAGKPFMLSCNKHTMDKMKVTICLLIVSKSFHINIHLSNPGLQNAKCQFIKSISAKCCGDNKSCGGINRARL